VDAKIKIALGLIAILILAAPVAIAQEVPAHVVISEVFYDESGTDNNEFCVLYNPTDSEIDIGDWTLNAFKQDGKPETTTTFPTATTIHAHMFYLIGEKDPLNSGDWGGTAMSPDCLRGPTDWQNGPDDYLVLEDSGGNYIDGVRWGHDDVNNPPAILDVPDNNTAPDAAAGESIERKPLGGGYAPCQDTDNNSFDFVVQETPTPKNSSTLKTGIAVTKVGDVTEAKPSTLVNFNITINNTGNCTLKHILVEDMLPAGMTFSYSVPDADSTNGSITWNDIGPLAANLSKKIELVVEIEEDAEGVLNNTVKVTGTPENATNVSASATALVSVIRVGIEKSCTSTVSLGGTVTYTITYSNPGGTNLTNVVITENYPADLTFISADPASDPGTNNTWTIGTLLAGESGKITVVMKVPASTWDFSYEETGSVSGEGIVMISKEMSTEQKPYKLENIVTISGSYNDTNVSATDSAITTVSASGSSLEITEHGSGTYESEEELNVDSKNLRIKYDKTTNAKYSPTTFKCSGGFVMEVPSKWSQDICIHNYAKEIALHKTITAATTLEDDTKIDTKDNGYSMKFDSKFLGYLHVGNKTEVAATSEHYIGEFEITSWDQGGKGIVDGEGYVIVDKDLDSGRLLLMEHGSGSYESEEDSISNRIAKETYAVYKPTQFNFSDSFVVNFSSKWMQDFCTRNRIGTVVLHKKIGDATIIDDETTAKSTPSQNYRTCFYGAFHWGEIVSKARTSNDYIGSFYIQSEAETNRTELFEWGKVPGKDEHQLKTHLKEPPFNMEWVEDAEFTKSDNNRTINITDTVGNHSAEIILSADNETAVLTTDEGGEPFEFSVESENNGKELYVYYTKLVKVTDNVMGEGFVMVDEYEGGMHLREHGSGIYYSDETFVPSTIYKYTYAKYMPTYFKFADSFAVNFSSLWVQDICVKDKEKGTAIHKRISNAAFMKDDTTATKSSESWKSWKSWKSLMNITSSFNGSMHIGARAENVGLSEDYIGEFNVTERIEIVKKEPKSSSSETSAWLFCPCPISSSPYLWFCQDPTYKGRWLSDCPYPYGDRWLYIHPEP
jgi:uncharacterized repeat protein (TIGR01451 family)